MSDRLCKTRNFLAGPPQGERKLPRLRSHYFSYIPNEDAIVDLNPLRYTIPQAFSVFVFQFGVKNAGLASSCLICRLGS